MSKQKIPVWAMELLLEELDFHTRLQKFLDEQDKEENENG